MLTNSRNRFVLLLSCLLLICAAAREARAQGGQSFDISSGGQPTITGGLGASVAGSASPLNNLAVTINFGEVSAANANSVVKVVVPVAVRSRNPYKVTVSVTGSSNVDPRAIQLTDIGFGVSNMRPLGGKAQICNSSSHLFYSPFNNDPSTSFTLNASGRVAYTSDLADVGSATTILSGPKLTQGTGSSRRDDDAWVFDAVFVITPQFFAPGTASATLTFQISSGPNVQC
ncbi:MAG: hypothetical protein JOZ96_17310 [Acidobacteria bacterium]|nr:hypothetical protein [Acidobacteriota bacterium]